MYKCIHTYSVKHIFFIFFYSAISDPALNPYHSFNMSSIETSFSLASFSICQLACLYIFAPCRMFFFQKSDKDLSSIVLLF